MLLFCPVAIRHVDKADRIVRVSHSFGYVRQIALRAKRRQNTFNKRNVCVVTLRTISLVETSLIKRSYKHNIYYDKIY